ncbi:hypothetical protein ACPPVU_17255 [Mucilaginibacter sp. McL0603]|uniref:hypothetical protein n=1 Tax=Mucilaginibacter sp. McL0603 TaxID=3415670 RepID=UPI003CF0CC29
MYTLITAANSAEAYNLKNKLGGDHILLGDYQELPDVLLQSGKMIKIPDPKSVSYTHQMLALCLDKDVNTIYALREQEKQLLVNAEQLFNEYGIKVKASDDKI